MKNIHKRPPLNICPQGLTKLCNAIVKRAAEDFTAAFMGYKVDNQAPEAVLAELTVFFHSSFYKTLVNNMIDGDWLMKTIKIEELKRCIKAYERALSSTQETILQIALKQEHKTPPLKFEIPPALTDDLVSEMHIQLRLMKEQLAGLEKVRSREDED